MLEVGETVRAADEPKELARRWIRQRSPNVNDRETSIRSDLAQDFIRSLLRRRQAAQGRKGTHTDDVDWHALWSLQPSASEDVAVGSAVVRAFLATQSGTALPIRRRTGVAVFTWIQNIGLIILLFVAWQLWGTAIAQHHDQSQLRTQFESIVRVHRTTAHPKPAALIPASAAVLEPHEGSGVARLQIPALGVDQIVVAGTSTSDLSRGPGHYTGTAMPGQEGNVAIAGHRTTDGAPFNRLGQLTVGDRVILTTLDGEQLTYRVSQDPLAVAPSDVAVLNNFGDNRITLTTCTPEFSASQRLIVVGRFQKGAVIVPEPASKTRLTNYHVTDSGTASWNIGLIPLVFVEVAALVALGLLSRRITRWIRDRIGRLGHWTVLLPLWALGLYFLFTSLTSFLPSAV
jgi:sortase A